ncbi:unnamed protein product [Ectocarpus sp. 13 AM-2016]
MNPNITPGSIHVVTRLHHLFKNRHCYCGKTNSSVGQRSTKTCASLTTKKNDRRPSSLRHMSTHTNQARELFLSTIDDAGSTVPRLGSSGGVVQRFTGRFNSLV